MLFDDLLKFYWPSGAVQSRRKPEQRRGMRRFPVFFWLNKREQIIKTFVLLIAVIFVVYGSASALGASTRLADQRNIIFDRLGTEDGVSQAVVTSITQDSHGFIWIGTQEGLNRYDGYKLETFYHLDNDPGSLSHDHIHDILEDSDGRLWIATDAGLNRFNEVTGSFEFVNHTLGFQSSDEHMQVYKLFEDSGGTLWLGTGNGLAKMLSESEFAHYHHDPDELASINAGPVREVYEGTSGNLWVGTDGSGLSKLDPASDRFTHYTGGAYELVQVSGSSIRSIVQDGQGKLWIASFDAGLSIFDPVSETATWVKVDPDNEQGLATDSVKALLKDHRGDIWVGTDGGLHMWQRENSRFLHYTHDPSDPYSIGSNRIRDLYQDVGGVIWAGTFAGVSKWNARAQTFPHFKTSMNSTEGLTSNWITSFGEGQRGNVWIGTFTGVNRWDSSQGRFTRAHTRQTAGLTDNRVMCLLSRGKELWAGTMGGGVNVIVDGEVVETFQHDSADDSSISANAITGIYEDSKGRVWLTTWGGGVNQYLGGGRFKRFPGPDTAVELPELRVLDIVEANDGNLWIAMDGGGVMVLNPETAESFRIRHDPDDAATINSDNVITLLSTEETMWVGTRDAGMARYRPEEADFVRYSKADGLASDAIYGMLEDDQDRIWVSGGKGLSMLDPETNEFTIYDSTHGLQSADFNSGAFLKLSDGSLLFGGSNGFNAFDPARISGNRYVPPVQLTAFTKFNKPVELSKPVYEMDSIEIEYGDSVIGFEFAAMDFTAPEKNQYQYKLEGFDRDWVDAGNTNQVTYTNLDPGNYTFRVRASNNDGVWNREGTSVRMQVMPPIWATWWAYVLYFLAGLGVLYQAQRANERRLRHEAEKRYSERLQLYIESLEEATDCVLIADENKNLMYANHAIRAILGLTPAEAVGRPLTSVLFSRNEDANAALQGLRQEGRWHAEVRNQRGNEFYTVENTISAVRDSDRNETAYISISRDVTERKKTEAELENHRRNLEFLVAERTKALEREIRENKEFQHELANSLREKELLLKEVHHRVKNNMQVISSLLNIQAETIGDDLFANLLGESQQRIKSMSLIHENLYQSDNLLEIDFEDYIKMLANSLCRFYAVPGVSINLDVQVVDVSLDLETAVPCGLIINELVSNSLKHAYKGCERSSGTISIVFRREGCRYVLKVTDDGGGLPEDFSLSNASSMGMEIVSILTQQIDGRLCFGNEEGAAFEISFPRKEKNVQ